MAQNDFAAPTNVYQHSTSFGWIANGNNDNKRYIWIDDAFDVICFLWINDKSAYFMQNPCFNLATKKILRFNSEIELNELEMNSVLWKKQLKLLEAKTPPYHIQKKNSRGFPKISLKYCVDNNLLLRNRFHWRKLYELIDM